MSMIEAIRNFLCGCPLLKDGKMNVDFLGEAPVEYVVKPGVQPMEPVRRYADGGALWEYKFSFGSREAFGAQVRTNLENSGFYEEFAAWVKGESDAGRLPFLGGGLSPQELRVQAAGFVYGANADTANYQIECSLIYYEGGKNR